MENNITIRKRSKVSIPVLPTGAKVVEKTERLSLEEIENGFILCKSVEIRYSKKGKDDDYGYLSYERKWFTKTDPLKVDLTDKSLADAFDED